jgi:hypothetical protein
MGHVIMENRNGLAVGARLTHATGRVEREAALELLGDIPRRRRITLGADKGYDVPAFVKELRQDDVTPHVASKRRLQRARWPHHPTCQLPSQPADAQAGGGDLRLAEDGGHDEKGATPRAPPSGLGLHLRIGRLQPRADTEPERGDRMKTRGCRNSFQTELVQALLEVDCHARCASRISQPRTE